MAKKPQSDTDDEQIISRRDGVTVAATETSLDSDARRALADARLRALAFSLGVEQNTRERAGKLDDTRLLAYLLDMLPEDDRITLEEALRGDAAAFERLMALRATFNSQTDKRDGHRADDLSRKILRHTVGRLEIRSAGEVLQFKDISEARQQPPEQLPPRSARRLMSSVVESTGPLRFREIGRPRLRLDPKTEILLSDVLDRIRSNFHAGGNLLNEAQSLLTRRREFNRRRPFEMRQTEQRMLDEQLTELLGELRLIGTLISEAIGEIDFTMDAEPPRVPRAEYFPLENARFDEPRRMAILPADDETWVDAFNIQAGAWTLRLTGTAVPTPQLAISLRGDRDGMRPEEPLLTLVRPAQGFEVVNVDPSGNGQVSVPPRESVLLVQGNEVWEVRLNFHNS